MGFTIRDILEGKPLGHPLHPLLVHAPIGLFLISLSFDIAWLSGAGEVFARGAFYLLILGVLGALVAAVPGLADYTAIRVDHPARRTASRHMLLNLAAVAVFILSVLVRWGDLGGRGVNIFAFICSAAGVGLILYSGYLGGTLVYDNGIGVGRHRRRTPLPSRTLATTAAVLPDPFVPVAGEEMLAEGQTLRVEVNGHVIALVRLEGKVHAFQEFCTHRYGPLSEGCFRGHEVICPWHESAFDVRSGQVTHGPAKVPLKTYETAVREGQICVKLPAREAAAEQREDGG